MVVILLGVGVIVVWVLSAADITAMLMAMACKLVARPAILSRDLQGNNTGSGRRGRWRKLYWPGVVLNNKALHCLDLEFGSQKMFKNGKMSCGSYVDGDIEDGQ
eukprot:11982817-Ditylum_brightwellii.AAC.1